MGGCDVTVCPRAPNPEPAAESKVHVSGALLPRQCDGPSRHGRRLRRVSYYNGGSIYVALWMQI